ncbi:MAG: HNH endonuclease, partial [Deltaproteobacteria bacterium]|nr:HNH endonuclease [Deltaproteobacteria bacterium]
VLEDGQGRVIDVGRKMRTVSAALQRALRADGEGCQFPGCSNCRFVEAHHIEHWIDGGETVLGNLVRLCSGHHKAVHDYGFGVARNEAGELVFTEPDGRPVSEEPTLRSWSSQEIDVAVKARSTQEAPGWDGMPVQWERCVDAVVAVSQ